MNRNLKKALTLGCAMLMVSGALSVSAANLTKKVEAVYNNIKVTYDGKAQAPQYEPFMINGTVYVSLRDAGQITNNTVNWDSTNKTVQITSKATQGSVSETELANKNLEIATLKNQVANLEKQVAYYKQLEEDKKEEEASKPSLDDKGMKKMLTLIEDEYDDKYDVDWGFGLTYNAKKEYIELEVSYDSKYDKSAFGRISESKLKTFFENICSDIQDELGSVEIRGEFVDDYKDETVSTFTYTTKGRFEYSIQITDKALKDMEDDLISDYTKLPSINFDSLKDLTIAIDDFKLEGIDNYETIIFTVYTNLPSDKKDLWNDYVRNASRSDKRVLRDFMEEIIKDLTDEFGSREFTGIIYNGNDKLIAKYEDGDISLETFR